MVGVKTETKPNEELFLTISFSRTIDTHLSVYKNRPVWCYKDHSRRPTKHSMNQTTRIQEENLKTRPV